MPKSVRDLLKKKTGQVLNNSAKAVLDLNELYDAFKEHHPDLAQNLATQMLIIAAARDKVIEFAGDAWGLDEDGIMKYMS